jgi:hypothetical protein
MPCLRGATWIVSISLLLIVPVMVRAERATFLEQQDPSLQEGELLDVLYDIGAIDKEAYTKAKERMKPVFRTALQPYVEFIGTFSPMNQTPEDDVLEYPGGPDKERMFSIRKAAFGLQGPIFHEWLKLKLTASAEQQDDGTLEFDLEDAYLQAAVSPAWLSTEDFVPTLGVHFGAMKVPFSRQSLTAEPRMQIINRAVVVEEFEFRRDIGATLDAGFAIGGRVATVTLRGGAFNGQGNRVYSADNNEKLLYVTRIRVDLLEQMGPGEGDLSPHCAVHDLVALQLEPVRPALSFGSSFFQNNDIDRTVRSWGIDGELRWMGFSLLGEYIKTEYDYDLAQDVVGDVKASRWDTDGWYVQGGVFLWPRLVEIVFRYEEYRIDLLNQTSDEARLALTTTGLNLYLTRKNDLKLMADYIHREESKGLPSLGNDTFTLGVSLVF